MLRLDPNVFIGTTPQASPWVPAEVTDGMVLTRLTVDGDAAELPPPPSGPGAQGANSLQAAQQAQAAQRTDVPTVLGLRTTSARVRLPA